MAATQTQLSHAWPASAVCDEHGVLQLGGCDALELARTYGTPAYVVDEPMLRDRARRFLAAFRARHGADVEVHFASKAFACTAVLRVLAHEGLACDVAGGGELAHALAAGFEPGRIHLHGNAKTDRELCEAVEAGIGAVVIDNADEVVRLEDLVRATGRTQRVLLRIAPGVSPDTHPAISTGGPNTKFGVNLDDAPELIARLRGSDVLELDGLHMHIGSQILDLSPFRAALEAMLELGTFRTWNLGGGLGVAYTADQHPPGIEEYVAEKVALVHELIGTDVRIADEPGRALVANAGVTLYTVQSVKRNASTWVAVDGGMADNPRPMLYGARYEAHLVGKPASELVACHVTGRHCESGDVLVADALLGDPRAGDVLAIPATGAYGHSMASNYNGALRPPVVFVGDGQAREVVRRETYADLLGRDRA